MPNTYKKNTVYSKKLLKTFTFIFLIFSFIAILILLNREKNKNTEIIQSKLSVYNEVITNFIALNNTIKLNRFNELDSLSKVVFNSELRITIIDKTGEVLYDNFVENFNIMEDHSSRNEIIQASNSKFGTDLRVSESTDIEYFYYAKEFSGYYIRTALPITARLKDVLKVDYIFIVFLLMIFLIMSFLLLYISDHFGRSIQLLRKFSVAMATEDDISEDIEFSNNELGEISKQIRKVYLESRETQKNLKIIKQQMTSNISHELKTPVAVISGFMETIMMNKDMDKGKILEFIERSFNQTKRLNSLIDDISVINKIDEAKKLYTKEEIDLKALIDNVISEMELSLKDHNINIDIFNFENSILNGNDNLLEAIFRNLIENSIKYAGKDIRIQIEKFFEDENYIHIKYSDNGIGIPAKHLPRIFERFYRIDKGRSRALGGTGLGLAIVKNAVNFHEGEISVNSLEQGIEFTFSLKK
ncbi:MAG: HAMP domain-containing sensor histidine kinase [Candidatus Delongbacteria bacterium]|jgi:signal transduction histidine kinase|nr:HAMP domain-containing sensor histidine kinase [Candidatus Delongbacteria bacterium]